MWKQTKPDGRAAPRIESKDDAQEGRFSLDDKGETKCTPLQKKALERKKRLK